MGCCSSKEVGDEATKVFNRRIEQDKERELSISKVLLLGPGESGKSTLFKQMVSIYGQGFSEEDKRAYREAVHTNIITGVKMLSEYYDVFSESKEIKHTLSDDADAARMAIIKANELLPELASSVTTFWKDPAIQEVYDKRNRFHLQEVAYFMDQVDALVKPDYLPSFQDIIQCRVRTTGIVELEFQTEKHVFKLFDMGGQRNERKKWIHCFENVTAVIYVTDMACYDQTLIEDDNVNRMLEAIALFDDICNGKWFKRTAMILFLNKRDLFAQKIKRVPLNTVFTDYKGPNEYQEAADYIQKMFEARNRQKKQVYIHLTCATQTDNIRMVFTAIKDIIIRSGLRDLGLV